MPHPKYSGAMRESGPFEVVHMRKANKIFTSRAAQLTAIGRTRGPPRKERNTGKIKDWKLIIRRLRLLGNTKDTCETAGAVTGVVLKMSCRFTFPAPSSQTLPSLHNRGRGLFLLSLPLLLSLDFRQQPWHASPPTALLPTRSRSSSQTSQ